MAKRKLLSEFTTNTDKAQPVKAAPAKAVQKGIEKKTGPKKPRNPKPSPDDKIISTTIRLNEAAWKQVKHASFDLGIPTNSVYTMALDDWFEKNGMPRIAQK